MGTKPGPGAVDLNSKEAKKIQHTGNEGTTEPVYEIDGMEKPIDPKHKKGNKKGKEKNSSVVMPKSAADCSAASCPASKAAFVSSFLFCFVSNSFWYCNNSSLPTTPLNSFPLSVMVKDDPSA